jgi:hypothetical protein
MVPNTRGNEPCADAQIDRVHCLLRRASSPQHGEAVDLSMVTLSTGFLSAVTSIRTEVCVEPLILTIRSPGSSLSRYIFIWPQMIFAQLFKASFGPDVPTPRASCQVTAEITG